jgi:hypothetical protein
MRKGPRFPSNQSINATDTSWRLVRNKQPVYPPSVLGVEFPFVPSTEHRVAEVTDMVVAAVSSSAKATMI